MDIMLSLYDSSTSQISISLLQGSEKLPELSAPTICREQVGRLAELTARTDVRSEELVRQERGKGELTLQFQAISIRMTSSTGENLCRQFSLAEMQLATGDFSDANVIGKGGFGKVYKGLIDNGLSVVAVKRLASNSKQGQREFAKEIKILSNLRHRNLVSLIGYCNEQGEMILVYEYMPKGTLADHLHRNSHRSTSLTWNERLRICIGAARGLDYLHTGSSVIHRDVKPDNILLDEKFTAKVSGFGLAKRLSGDDLESHVSASVKGSFGYFDPSYIISGRLTKASDTYAFGVVLLEVLSGRPAVDDLTMWAQEKIRNGKFQEIVASTLRGEVSEDCLKTYEGVVKRCLVHEPKARLSMTQAVVQLEFALDLQERKGLKRNLQFRSFDAFWNRDVSSAAPADHDNGESVENQAANEPQATRFTWEIHNFSLLHMKKQYSDIFTVGGYKWRVHFLPKAKNVDYLSIYLGVADSATLPHGWSRYAQFSLAIVNQLDNKLTVKKETQHQFNKREPAMGFAAFMPLSELYDPSKGYLVNDTCVVEAVVEADVAHLYTIIKVARDEDLREQIGKDIYFDLVDHDKVRNFRIQKHMPFNLFKEEVAKEFGVPVQLQRFWIWAKRQNHTYRPHRPLTPQEEAQTVGQWGKVTNNDNNSELKLFLEVERGWDLLLRPLPKKNNDDILLFFKLYDPLKEELRYVGRLTVRSSGNPVDILTKLNELAGFAPVEEIDLFEEIKFDPDVMCERVDKTTSFQLSQIENGDIICFQKQLSPDIKEQVRFPDVPSFMKYLQIEMKKGT